MKERPRIDGLVILIYATVTGAFAITDGLVAAANVSTPVGRTDTDAVVTVAVLGVAVVLLFALMAFEPGERPHKVVWWAGWAFGAGNIAALVSVLLPASNTVRLVAAVVGTALCLGCGFELYPDRDGGRHDGA